MEKQLFVAEVLRELYINGKSSYCELAIVIIKASSSQEAETSAEQFGQSQKRSYKNEDGEGDFLKIKIRPTGQGY